MFSKISNHHDLAPTNAQARVWQSILLPYFQSNQTDAQNKFFNPAFPTGTPEEVAATLETQATDRRVLFLTAVTPLLRSRLASDIALEAFRPYSPEVDISILRFFLAEVIKVGTPVKSALAAVSESLKTNETAFAQKFTRAYFIPFSTDTYSFFVPDSQLATQPVVQLDGVSVTWTGESSRGWTSNAFSLVNGQEYLLTRVNGNFVGCSYSTARSPSLTFGSNVLIDDQLVASTTQILYSISRAASVAVQFNLNLAEITAFQGLPSTRLAAVNFGNISFQHVEMIGRYASLRDRTSSVSIPLTDFLKSIGQMDGGGSLTDQLSRVTGITSIQVQDYLTAKFPRLSAGEQTGLFDNLVELESLLDARDLLSRLGLPGLTFASLFKWSTPIQPVAAGTTVASEFDNAAELRSLINLIPNVNDGEESPIAKANNIIRKNQQSALTAYLL